MSGKNPSKISRDWNIGSRPVRRHILTLALLLAALALSACRRGPTAEAPAGPTPDAVYVLDPVFTNAKTAEARALIDELFPGALHAGPDRAEAAMNRCLAERKVLIVPHPREFPLNLWHPVRDFLARGGPVVWWGRDPLAGRMGQGVDGFQEEAELLDTLVLTAAEQPALAATAGSLVAAQGAGAAVTPAADAPWPAVVLSADAFHIGLGLRWAGFGRKLVSAADNTLAFYAWRQTGATRLVVQATEQDGSTWRHIVTPSTTWSPVLAHEGSFIWRRGGTNRGAEGDHLDLSNIRSLYVGLLTDALPQDPGAQKFGVSDIRVASDPRSLEDAVGWPDLPLLCPPTRRYDVTAPAVEFIATGQTFPTEGLPMQSPLPRPTGYGGDQADRGRWIPLARALDADGSTVGWPASLYVARDGDGPLFHFAWVAAEIAGNHRDAVGQMLRTAVRRLRAGFFLYQGGADRAAFEAGRTFDVTANWSAGLGDARALRVAAELIDQDGNAVRRVLSPPPPEIAGVAPEAVKLSLGTSRRMPAVASDRIVRLLLVDREDRAVFDTMDQIVKVFPEEPPFDDRPVVEGSGFILGRRPVFLLGTDYAPHTVSGLTEREAQRSWLHPARFDPRVVQRDLDRLQQLGINLLGVSYRAPEEGPQLRSLLEEARLRGMWVDVHMEALNPLRPDFERARALIAAARLATTPRAFAFEIARGPHLGIREERQALDGAWKAWIEEQYGSVKRAESVLEPRLWKRDGEPTGPADEELVAGTNLLVQVYRRFVQDTVSRRCGEVRRFLVREGCRQLLTMRFGVHGLGNSGDEAMMPLDPLAGAAHLDFLTLDGSALLEDTGEIQSAGFLAAYARGVSGGKPVVWSGFGAAIGYPPEPAELQNQARIAEQALAMAVNSRSAGALAAAYTGRDRTRDRGLTGPDARWRPCADAFRSMSGRLRRTLIPPQPWRGRELPILPSAQSLSALWPPWRDIYREEVAAERMEELRPGGFGAETRNATFLSLADVEHKDPAPFALLNGEWGSVSIAGEDRARKPGETIVARQQQELRLEIINTGPALWSASQDRQSRSVWIRAVQAGRADQKIRLPALTFGERTTVVWPAADPGVWVFRPWVSDVGSFGEALRVEVTAAPTKP